MQSIRINKLFLFVLLFCLLALGFSCAYLIYLSKVQTVLTPQSMPESQSVSTLQTLPIPQSVSEEQLLLVPQIVLESQAIPELQPLPPSQKTPTPQPVRESQFESISHHQNFSKKIKSENILVQCKTFTKEECVGYLGRDVISAGYKPIKISIENYSKQYLKFSTKNISLKIVPAELVVKKVFYNTAGRAAGWGIAGLFMPILWIPGAIHSVKAHKDNKRLSADFITKSATNRLIAPKSRMEGVIFVGINDYKNFFDIVLIDTDSQKKVFFKIDMNKSSQ